MKKLFLFMTVIFGVDFLAIAGYSKNFSQICFDDGTCQTTAASGTGGGSSIYAATGTASFPFGLSASTGVFSSSVSASQFYASSGSAAAPSYSFQTRTDLGIYRFGTSDMRVAVNGTDDMKFTTSGPESFLQHAFADGTEAAPSITFGGQMNTGFRRQATSKLEVDINGVGIATFTTSGLNIKSVTWPDGTVQVSSPSSTAFAPGINYQLLFSSNSQLGVDSTLTFSSTTKQLSATSVAVGTGTLPGQVQFAELQINGTNYAGIVASPSFPITYNIQLPTTTPIGNQMMVMSAVITNGPYPAISTGSWISAVAPLTIGSGAIGVDCSSVSCLGQTIALGSETTGIYESSATAGPSMKITGTNNVAGAAPIFNVDCASVTCEGQITVSAGSGSSIYAATTTIQTPFGQITSTLTMTSQSAGVLHVLANSSNVVTGLVALSTETAGIYVASVTAGASMKITGTNNASNAAPIFNVDCASVTCQGPIAASSADMILASTQTSGGAKKWASYSDFIGSVTFQSSVLAQNITTLSTTTLNGILVVKASSTFNGELGVVTTSTAASTIGNGLIVAGHIEVSSATPVISSCGSTPNGSVVGNDVDGKITIGGGVVTSCTMTFAAPWPNAPSCPFVSNTAITSPTGATTTTTFTLGSGATFNGDVIMYHCGSWR